MNARALVLFGSALVGTACMAMNDTADAGVREALERSGANRSQLEAALAGVPREQQKGMRFLIANMPDRDLRELGREFLVENSALAYRVWKESRWREQVSEQIFLNCVLPYAVINERRDDWRGDFARRFGALVRNARTPGEAAAILNRKIFGLLNVRYSTGRPKADQSPFESMEAGLASCSGLSVLLVDACRAVGIPARFVGTPLWSDNSGNHSWVEVWDNGWHFTGAAEPTGEELDRAWFVARASAARRDDPRHAIYAVSFQRTSTTFPLVWDREIDYVCAVNVTDRYADRGKSLPPGRQWVRFRVLGSNGERCAAHVIVRAGDTGELFSGECRDDRFDANDHLSFPLMEGKAYRVEIEWKGCRETADIEINADLPVVTLHVST